MYFILFFYWTSSSIIAFNWRKDWFNLTKTRSSSEFIFYEFKSTSFRRTPCYSNSFWSSSTLVFTEFYSFILAWVVLFKSSFLWESSYLSWFYSFFINLISPSKFWILMRASLILFYLTSMLLKRTDIFFILFSWFG